MKSNRMGSLYFIFTLSLLSITIASEISGKVTFSSPVSVGAVTKIVAKNIDSGDSYNTTVLEDGTYSIEVPNGHYLVEGYSSDTIAVSDWFAPKYFSISNDMKIVNNASLDFTFEPCFTVIALGFDDTGNPIYFNDFSSFSWATNLDRVAARASITEVFTQSLEESTLGFSLPIGESRFLMSQFKIARAGNVVLTATNGGKGFSGAKEGGMIINLNFEFAREALSALTEKSNSDNYPSLSNDVYFIDLQGKMKNATKQTSESFRAIISNQIVAESLEKETELEMQRANKDILKYRKSNLNIRVSDEKGNAVPDVLVKLEQQTREFRFGMYGGQIPEGQEEYWRSMVSAGINSATVDFWWIDTEPTMDNVNKNYILGQRIDFLKSLGLKLRATGMFQPDPEIIPQYALQLNFQDFSEALYAHTFKMVSSYCKDFELIEVSTDLNSLANKMGYNSSQILQLQQIALNAIKKAAPNVKTSVSMPEDYYAQSKFNSFRFSEENWDKLTLSPFDFSKLWIEAGQDIDQIGQQMYNGGNRAALSAPTSSYNPSFTLGTLSSHLDKLSTLGKSIRVSEIAVPGTWGGNWDDSEAGFLVNRWNEASQSDFIEKFYTMAFSKALNREITWWGLFDSAFAYPGGTFLDSNGNPKKSFQTLKNLIQSWTTKSDVTSDFKGTASISAFGGSYKVSAYKNGALIGMSEMKFQEGKQLSLSVKVTQKGTTFSTTNLDMVDPVVGPVPVPIQNTEAVIGSSNVQSTKSVPNWVIAVTVVGGVALFAIVSIVVLLLTMRRRAIAKLNEGSETPTSNAKKDVGLATKDTVKYDSDLEAGSEGEKKSNINITWMGQPLTNVPLDYSASEGECSDSGRESENEAEEPRASDSDSEVSEVSGEEDGEEQEDEEEEEERLDQKENFDDEEPEEEEERL